MACQWFFAVGLTVQNEKDIKYFIGFNEKAICHEIFDIVPANRLNYLKIVTKAAGELFLNIEDFKSDENEISLKFKEAKRSLSRSQFVSTWKELEKRKHGKDDITIEKETVTQKKASNSTFDVYEFEDDANTTELPTIKRQKITNKDQVHEPAKSTLVVREPSSEVSVDLSRLIIEKKLAGYFKADVMCLKEQRWQDLHRPAESTHIEYLVKCFLKNPYSYYHMIVVNIPELDSTQTFDPEKINTYNLEVIGGNHSRIVYQKLIKEYSDKAELYHSRIVKVFCGLTHEEARRVGMETNQVHTVNLRDTWKNTIISMRKLLYAEAGVKQEASFSTIETPVGDLLIQTWKTKLQVATGCHTRKSLNNSHRLGMALAQSPLPFWKLFQPFMLMIENGEVLGFKRTKVSRRLLQFMDPGAHICDLLRLLGPLEKVTDKTITFSTFKNECLKLLGKNVTDNLSEKQITQKDTCNKSVADESSGVPKNSKENKTCEKCKKCESTASKMEQICEENNTMKRKLKQSEKEIDDLKKQLKQLKSTAEVIEIDALGEIPSSEKNISICEAPTQAPSANSLVVLNWGDHDYYVGKVQDNGTVMSTKLSLGKSRKALLGGKIPKELLEFNKNDVEEVDWHYLVGMFPQDYYVLHQEFIEVTEKERIIAKMLQYS